MAWTRRAAMAAAAACSAGSWLLPRAAAGAVFAADALWNTTPGIRRSEAYGIPRLSVGLSSWISDGGWSVPVYQARHTDPLCNVLYHDNWSMVASGRWKRSGNSAVVERDILARAQLTFPFPGNSYSSQSVTDWVLPTDYRRLVNPPSPPRQVKLPRHAVPASEADGHMAVWQPDGTVFECYAGIRLSTGQIVATTYIVNDPDGAGDYRQNGKTASMIPCYAGLIMEAEARAGAINHALRVAVGPEVLKPAWVYPAGTFDRGAGGYAGQLPMGTRLALPSVVDPDAMAGVTSASGRMFARTMKNHGAIIVDRGGPGGLTVYCDTRMSYAVLTSYNPTLADELQQVFNIAQVAS